MPRREYRPGYLNLTGSQALGWFKTRRPLEKSEAMHHAERENLRSLTPQIRQS
jgi:hypothetical protein